MVDAMAVPAIPSLDKPNEIAWQDLYSSLSAMKYNMDLREGNLGEEFRFIPENEIRGFIVDVYSELRGQIIKDVIKGITGDPADTVITLDDIEGDGKLIIRVNGQLVIQAAGGLLIEDVGTLIVDVGSAADPTGSGILVGDISGGTGVALNQTGIWMAYNNIPAHAFSVSADAIAWQRELLTGAALSTVGITRYDAGFTMNLGDVVLGGYNYYWTATGLMLGGIYWNQSASTLHLRGNIENMVVDSGGILTIKNTGYLYIQASADNSGLLVGDLVAATGWWLNASGIRSFVGGVAASHAFLLADQTWQGIDAHAHDAFIGTYGSGKGLYWDNTNAELNLKGELVQGTISDSSWLSITGSGYVKIDTSGDVAGLLIGTWDTGQNAFKFNKNGFFTRSASYDATHAFTLDSCLWGGLTMGAGDAVIGNYNDGAGLFWDQDPTPTLYIKGRLVLATVTAGDLFTVSSTGYIFINTSSANSGLIVGDYLTGTGWMMNSSGLFGYSGSSGRYCFPLTNITWNSQSLVSGDFWLGSATQYVAYYGSWLRVAGTIIAGSSSSINGLAATSISGWAHASDTTKIDGGDIYANSITLNAINGASGTLTINGGAIAINAASGLSVGGSGTVVLATGGDVVLGTTTSDSAEVRWTDSGKIYARSTGNFVVYNSAGTITVDGTTSIYFQIGSTNKMIVGTNLSCYADLLPSSSLTKNLGGSSLKWSSIYGRTYYYCYIYSSCPMVAKEDPDLDCLAILENFKSLKDDKGETVLTDEGFPKLDKRSCPEWLTNKEELYDEMKRENGELYDRGQFEDDWEAGEFEAWRAGQEKSHTIDIAIGAILQLNRELRAEVQGLRGQIDALKAARGGN